MFVVDETKIELENRKTCIEMWRIMTNSDNNKLNDIFFRIYKIHAYTATHRFT